MLSPDLRLISKLVWNLEFQIPDFRLRARQTLVPCQRKAAEPQFPFLAPLPSPQSLSELTVPRPTRAPRCCQPLLHLVRWQPPRLPSSPPPVRGSMPVLRAG